METPIVSEEYRNSLAMQGQTIYDTKLKAQLEPLQNNRYVVIHVDTEDYAVGTSISAAKRELRRRHPCDGRLVGLKIGPEPEYGLSARFLVASWGN